MYDSSMKRKWDNENVLEYAVTEAKKEGFNTGIQKGFLEGEHKKALEIARKLKEMGMLATDISKGTGLSEEEISEL